MHHSSMSREINLLYFFSWIFTWFLQKDPIKVQIFRLLTAQVKHHQICSLIGSFFWKYIKYIFFVSKKTIIWWILIRALKSKKKNFDWFFLFFLDLKKHRGVIFYDTRVWCNISRNTDLWFGKWHEELGTRKSQNWDFHWVLLYKVENIWA